VLVILIDCFIKINYFSLIGISNANDEVKKPQVNNAFSVARIFGSIIAIVMTIMLFALAKVKDNSKYGVKVMIYIHIYIYINFIFIFKNYLIFFI